MKKNHLDIISILYGIIIILFIFFINLFIWNSFNMQTEFNHDITCVMNCQDYANYISDPNCHNQFIKNCYFNCSEEIRVRK